MINDDVPRDTAPTAPTAITDTRRPIDVSAWLTLDQAAAAIGVSTRTVERLAHAGKIEQRLRSQARGHDVVVYYPADVAERAAERRQGTPPPFVVPAPATSNGNGRERSVSTRLEPSLPAGDDPLRLLFAAALRAVLAPTTSPTSPTVSAAVSETPWVDIPTAAAILGRSQAYVRRQIAAGALHAERDRCLVVRRKDLEQL